MGMAFFSRHHDGMQRRRHRNLAYHLYARFRSGNFSNGDHLPLSVATISCVAQDVNLYFLPPATEEAVDCIVDGLQEEYVRRRFGKEVLQTIDDYCAKYGNREPERDPLAQEFFESLVDHQDEVFSGDSRLYKNVQLIENGDTPAFVDFVQADMVAKIRVVAGNRGKERRKKRNDTLHRAAEFFERHYGPMKQYRIDGREEGGDWNVSVVDITTGQRVLYRKI